MTITSISCVAPTILVCASRQQLRSKSLGVSSNTEVLQHEGFVYIDVGHGWDCRKDSCKAKRGVSGKVTLEFFT